MTTPYDRLFVIVSNCCMRFFSCCWFVAIRDEL